MAWERCHIEQPLNEFYSSSESSPSMSHPNAKFACALSIALEGIFMSFNKFGCFRGFQLHTITDIGSQRSGSQGFILHCFFQQSLYLCTIEMLPLATGAQYFTKTFR